MAKLLHLLVFIALMALPLTGASYAPQSGWQSKVDKAVLLVADEDPVEFIVYMREQADLSGAQFLTTKTEKGRYVYDLLTATAKRTQGPALAELNALAKANPGRVDFRPYWVTNMIWVRGDAEVLRAMASRTDIAGVYANPQVRVDLPAPLPQPDAGPADPQTIEWNLVRVQAPEVWAKGYTGQGVVIGGQDTGYQWDHPALINKYRGWDGSTADHNYNWHDAIHAGVYNGCYPNSWVPCDDNGHGTHTMGTMAGGSIYAYGSDREIGMAPNARWIGCRNMGGGIGTPTTYTECYQWFIAPTDLNGLNPRPDLAPDVINNSWSCPPSEGCAATNPNVLKAVVDAVRAAGIVTVHSAGNSGPGCSSIDNPAGTYDASFTVGASDSADNIASFSSRGPVAVDGSNRIKPDISAPGVSVLSAWRNNGYNTISGTSMAAPHVAGLVALLLSARPELAGNVDAIEDLIRRTAVQRTTSEACGSLPGSQIPNNTYGWGRINALAATSAAEQWINLLKTPSTYFYKNEDVITYTLQLTHYYLVSPTTGVVLTDTLPTGTSFVGATLPYTLDGQVVIWNLPALGPGESLNFELAVQPPETGTPVIRNQSYGVRSDHTFNLSSPPVLLYHRDTIVYLPVIWR